MTLAKKTLYLLMFIPLLHGCSTLVQTDLAITGMPSELFQGDSTVITKYMDRDDVSAHCQKKIGGSKLLPAWHHACVYRKSNGEIVMALPKPGTMDSKAYAGLLQHEYQHVGQILTGQKIDHGGWQ